MHQTNWYVLYGNILATSDLDLACVSLEETTTHPALATWICEMVKSEHGILVSVRRVYVVA